MPTVNTPSSPTPEEAGAEAAAEAAGAEEAAGADAAGAEPEPQAAREAVMASAMTREISFFIPVILSRSKTRGPSHLPSAGPRGERQKNGPL